MPGWKWAGRARSRLVAAVLVVFAVLSLAALPARAERLFNTQQFTLDNGLTVVVIPDHRVPVVRQMIWYKAGAIDEPPGKSGIAHFLEHLMFKGTPSVPQGEFSRQVTRSGGQENAFTSYDYTAFYQNIAKPHLEMVMRMEADRMTNLTLTDAQVAPEKQVVLEERRMRIDNDPAAVLSEQARAIRYLNHPYRRPIIGWEHEMQQLTTEDAIAFYRSWYAPNNAILVVAGDVTPDEVRTLAERTYGAIPRRDLPPRLNLTEPAQPVARRAVLTDERVRQPSWTRTWLAPGYLDGAPQAYPLQVLEEVLGGGATSLLYKRLVVERGLAVSAAAWYDPSHRGPSEFVIYSSPRPGVSLEQIEAEVDVILHEVLDKGVDPAEVKRATERMVADAVYARDSFGTAAQWVGEALAIGRTVDDVDAWPERIRAVTPDQVNTAARLVLAQPGTVTAELRPTGTAPAEPEGPRPAMPTSMGSQEIR